MNASILNAANHWQFSERAIAPCHLLDKKRAGKKRARSE
jgi:hypothetical protein